jgi:4-alpha-glucanotransferase
MEGRAGREAGILVPLFSLRGRGWGIGEFGDVGDLCQWLATAGHRLLQLLPIAEMAEGERSPYGAVSAFALDPIFLSIDALEDFAAVGGERALPAAERAALDHLRAGAALDYDEVRALKRAALERAFAHFETREWPTDSARGRAFRCFCESEARWLDGYALFRAAQDRRPGTPWLAWEPPLRDRSPGALTAETSRTERARRFHAYVQWLAAEQWQQARAQATAAGVRLKGDFPFMLSANSADVWERQDSFDLDASLGAPPDQFDSAGQDWELPVPRWGDRAGTGYAWLRARAARMATLFDAFRIDHVVGFYRMYVLRRSEPPMFVPADPPAQLERGEELMRVILEAGATAEVMAEDLGAVPAFVRRSLTTLGVPGYRILRWEEEGGVFRDPAEYPALSTAASGTHDTSPLATWWEDELGDAGRRALAAVPSFACLAAAGRAWTPAVHAALLDGLYGAGSKLVVLPFPDVYGGRERINTPSTTGSHNWSYRVPWTLRELREGEAGRELVDRLRTLAARPRRLPMPR